MARIKTPVYFQLLEMEKRQAYDALAKELIKAFATGAVCIKPDKSLQGVSGILARLSDFLTPEEKSRFDHMLRAIEIERGFPGDE